MNAELKTIMTRLDEVQRIFDETCRTNAGLAATAIDELRSTLAEAVTTINLCMKKIRSDAHNGIVANRKFLLECIESQARQSTTRDVDVATKAEKARNAWAAEAVKEFERVEEAARKKRVALEDSFTADLGALADKTTAEIAALAGRVDTFCAGC